MTEEDGSHIDVDALMARIGARATVRGGDATLDAFSSIEDLLVVAEARTAFLDRVPFVRRIVRKVLAVATGDQRRVNLTLVAALRASVAAHRDLAERVGALESEGR